MIAATTATVATARTVVILMSRSAIAAPHGRVVVTAPGLYRRPPWGENKTTVTDAGPSTRPALCSGEPDLIRQEFWAWLVGTQLVRKSGAASTTADGARPVTTDQISFTGMRREANRFMVQTLVAAATSPAVLAALAEAASRAALGTVIVTGRQRRSGRRQKSRPGFPHTQVTARTVTGPVTITRFQPETGRPAGPRHPLTGL
jgi:hypothetical protein